MRRQRHSALLVVLFFATAGLSPAARAYLDPSTGSMILSAIVGIFATLGLALKTWWYKLKNLLTRRGQARSPDPTQQQPAARNASEASRVNRPS